MKKNKKIIMIIIVFFLFILCFFYKVNMNYYTLDPLNKDDDLYLVVSFPKFNQSEFTAKVAKGFFDKLFYDYLELYTPGIQKNFTYNRDLSFRILKEIIEHDEFFNYRERFQFFLNSEDLSFIPTDKHEVLKMGKELFMDYKRYLKNGLSFVRQEDFLSLLRNTRPLPISKLDIFGSEEKENSALLQTNPDIVFTASIFLLRNNLINKNTTNYIEYNLDLYSFRTNFAMAFEIAYMFYFLNEKEQKSFNNILKKEKIDINLGTIIAYKEFMAIQIMGLTSSEIFNCLEQIFSNDNDKKLFLELYDANIKYSIQNPKRGFNLDDIDVDYRFGLFRKFLRIMKHIEDNREEIINIMTPYIQDSKFFKQI